MRIAIIGGTFNPVTKAHIAIAKNAKEFVKADLVIFVPTKIDYIKKWKKYQNSDIYTDDLRLNMLRACENEWMKIDTCEMEGIVSGRTYDTVQYIKEKYHTKDVYFIIGSDKLKELPRWYKCEKFLKEEKFIVIPRDQDHVEDLIGNNHKLSQYKNAFIIAEADAEYKNYSSTKVRKYIRDGYYEKAKEMIPEYAWSVFVLDIKNRKETG